MNPDLSDRLRVVLVATRNPLNIGAVARAMSNFGFFRLSVVQPYEVAFREVRSAVGAPDLLKNAEEFASVPEAIADCSLVVGTSAMSNRQVPQPVKSLEEGGELIRSCLETERVALLFGSEKRGLSNDDLSYCHWLMRIPTREEHLSMNLGQAVAVCLYELIRADAVSVTPAVSAHATGAELERLTRTLLEGLAFSGYIKPGTKVATEEKTRRLVRRLSLDSDAAETLTGMLAKMLGAGIRAQKTEP